MICPAVAHRLPEVFSNPELYDPARFAPGRAEDRQHPYSLIGFSAGFYRCPGAGFGTNEMKCILSMLLQRYTLELVWPRPARDFEMGVIRPKPPCLIKYARRQLRRSGPARRARSVEYEPGATACPAHQVRQPPSEAGALVGHEL
jgi:sterol 14-demethylase